jgi:tryptophan synthase alpha subunit
MAQCGHLHESSSVIGEGVSEQEEAKRIIVDCDGVVQVGQSRLEWLLP